MITIQTERPRDIDSWRAAGILYGDLGTSKAYVLGLAFALAAYSSFWFILAVSILTLLVGLNYITICKLYPNGGGVYSSARKRSKILAFIGGFFLISDYLVTAALSATSAFHYLGVAQPEYWAIASIALIGLFNFVGPKYTGGLSIVLAIPTVLCIVSLGLVSLPFILQAAHLLKPISGNIYANWTIFVGIIVALSGIESIANTTGSMKLDPGSTSDNPSVGKTSTPAILLVLAEVCFFTALLGLAMNALPGLEISDGDVNAPGYPNVRDSMLRYMADFFSGTLFGPVVGHIFSFIISIVIMLLLLSAVNTAMIALISLLYVMSQDGELPANCQKLNRFGVPVIPTLASFLLPIAILLFISDISGLANLYAVGFVGAIAVNLGCTSTNKLLDISMGKRIFMFCTFVIMGLIEISLLIDKPEARVFVISIMAFGLLLRSIVAERKEEAIQPITETPVNFTPIPENSPKSALVATTGLNKSVDFAIEAAKDSHLPLYILFVRERKYVPHGKGQQDWKRDKGATDLYNHVQSLAPKTPVEFIYTVTSDTAHSVVDIAKMKKVTRIIIGRKRGLSSWLHFIRGTTINKIAQITPKDMSLEVIY